jgi:hypothetical protein
VRARTGARRPHRADADLGHPGPRNDEPTAENPLIKMPSRTTDGGAALLNSPVIGEYRDNLAGGG